jgi:hypothetical protein
LSEQPAAVLTRNRYGAIVLNTAKLLFLDIDLPPATLLQKLGALFSRNRPRAEETALASLRTALREHGRGTFRIYRTAAGFRAIAVDREYDPAGADAQALMRASGTDPAFARLCVAQKSFRARLTPKPWRCGTALPPGEHPRTDDGIRRRFAAWTQDYDRLSKGYAACRYVETVGSSSARGTAEKLIALHDRLTKCSEALPLA